MGKNSANFQSTTSAKRATKCLQNESAIPAIVFFMVDISFAKSTTHSSCFKLLNSGFTSSKYLRAALAKPAAN